MATKNEKEPVIAKADRKHVRFDAPRQFPAQAGEAEIARKIHNRPTAANEQGITDALHHFYHTLTWEEEQFGTEHPTAVKRKRGERQDQGPSSTDSASSASHPTYVKHAPRSHLMNLPAELRDKIYDYLLSPCVRWGKKNHFTALAVVNRQISVEFLEKLYRRDRTFAIDIYRFDQYGSYEMNGQTLQKIVRQHKVRGLLAAGGSKHVLVKRFGVTVGVMDLRMWDKVDEYPTILAHQGLSNRGIVPNENLYVCLTPHHESI